ncbi:MAG: hypothetical protein ACI906_004163 [Candidatus Latescibacterota bacterium]|jgi:hypothetical protein
MTNKFLERERRAAAHRVSTCKTKAQPLLLENLSDDIFIVLSFLKQGLIPLRRK